MSIDISDVIKNNPDMDILKKIIDTMIEAKLLCDFGMDKIEKSSRGNCRVYSKILQNLLKENFPKEEWNITGGWERYIKDNNFPNYCDKNIKGGMWATYSEEYESHYWIHNPKLNIYLDTSADQFGYSEVLIVSEDNSIYSSNLNEDYIEKEVCYDTNNYYADKVELRKIQDPVERYHTIIKDILDSRKSEDFIKYQVQMMDYLGYNEDLEDLFPLTTQHKI